MPNASISAKSAKNTLNKGPPGALCAVCRTEAGELNGAIVRRDYAADYAQGNQSTAMAFRYPDNADSHEMSTERGPRDVPGSPTCR